MTLATSPKRRLSIADVFGKLPDAQHHEAALLGSLILNGDELIPDVSETVKPSDFTTPQNVAVYNAMVQLHAARTPIEIMSIQQHLRDRKQFDQVGGLEFLLTLGESVPSAALAMHYAKEVRSKGLRREVDAVVVSHLERVRTDAAAPIEELIDALESDVLNMAIAAAPKKEHASIASVLQSAFEQLTSEAGVQRGLETGFNGLDELTGGLLAGELIILAARPSIGKTAFATNVIERVAFDQGLPVGFFSLEMTLDQLAMRILLGRAGVDQGKARRRMFSSDDIAAMAGMIDSTGSSSLLIDDNNQISLGGIRAQARRWVRQRGVKLLAIDYLQLVRGPKSETREQEVSAIARGLKGIARELGVPVLCLSQLNRNLEHRDNKRPQLSDLRESGSIEQDADVVLMLHREDYFHKDDPAYQPDFTGEIAVAKQRNGPLGTAKLRWEPTRTTFYDAPGGTR